MTAIGRWPSRERDDGGADDTIRDARGFTERRVPRREQAAVEGGDDEVAGMTARMGESRDRLERGPQAGGIGRAHAATVERADAVGIAIDLVTRRHQRPRFGKQEEEQAVHDGQRLLEAWRRSRERAARATAVAGQGA